MAALGDSITRGFNACGGFADCPARSWSTGIDPAVRSHYLRLVTQNGTVTAHNDAQSGAKMAALPGQASTAVSEGVEYVTILMGANDACATSESDMTEVGEFESQFRTALETLDDGLPDTAILVASIPDLKRLWAVGKDNADARAVWDALDICPSMLANPTSTDSSDQARRDRVHQRIIDYNGVLEAVCGEYPNCRFDDNAVFSYQFTLDHLSEWDYFHPNTSGQAILAELTYRNGFGWTPMAVDEDQADALAALRQEFTPADIHIRIQISGTLARLANDPPVRKD